MEANPVADLSQLAVAVFRGMANSPIHNTFSARGVMDPVADGVPLVLTQMVAQPEFRQAVSTLEQDPDFAAFTLRPDSPAPFFSFPSTGFQAHLPDLVEGLVASAFRLVYYQGIDRTEAALVRQVIENYEELKKASRGEPVRIYSVLGFSGIRLTRDLEIRTPWGPIRSAPEPWDSATPRWLGMRSPTSALLLVPRLVQVQIGPRSPELPAFDKDYFAFTQRIGELLPLAFALATGDTTPCTSVATFISEITPMDTGHGASMAGPTFWPRAEFDVTPRDAPGVEEWSRRLDRLYVEHLRVAGRRIVSAIGERTDRSDSLIDAVTAWESLVGTRTETVFRVTGALAKLLEDDPLKRRALQSELKKIYARRSEVVHGVMVDPVKIDAAADRAITFAILALRQVFEKGDPWLQLESEERADRLLLEE